MGVEKCGELVKTACVVEGMIYMWVVPFAKDDLCIYLS